MKRNEQWLKGEYRGGHVWTFVQPFSNLQNTRFCLYSHESVKCSKKVGVNLSGNNIKGSPLAAANYKECVVKCESTPGCVGRPFCLFLFCLFCLFFCRMLRDVTPCFEILSVGRSVGQLVTFYFYFFGFIAFLLLRKCMVCLFINTPAQPHAITLYMVYPALFFFLIHFYFFAVHVFLNEILK